MNCSSNIFVGSVCLKWVCSEEQRGCTRVWLAFTGGVTQLTEFSTEAMRQTDETGESLSCAYRRK
jgi:hypothetical protein